MSRTQISSALSEVRDAVEAPPVDRLAFRARVRTERRRRTAGRAGIALAGVAAATVAAVGVSGLLQDTAPVREGFAAGPVVEPRHLVGFVVEDELVVGGPEGFAVSDVPARNVLGSVDGVVVLTDGTGALLGVPVDDAGRAGDPLPLVPGEVRQAWLDSAGVVRVLRADGTLVRVAPGEAWEPEPAPEGELYLIDRRARVETVGRRLQLRIEPTTRRSIRSGGGVTDGSLAAGVLALETERGVRFYDATGRRTAVIAGTGLSGALAPDGGSYARVSEDELTLVDPSTGEAVPVDGPDSFSGGVAWTSAETFVVTTRSDGDASLWECDAPERTCRVLYEDPSGTLKLTS